VKLRSIISILNTIAPPEYACSWDQNNGLQIGNKNQEIKKVFITLDVTEKTISKAIKQQADLIIAHHPLIFGEINRLDFTKPPGKSIQKLIKNDIALFIAHTNLDAAAEGVNWTLARQEGLNPEKCQVLEPTYSEKLFKYVVFVPETALDKVHQAITEADGGHIGNYAECTFRTSGTGTFLPGENTHPHIGKKNILEKVPEVKIETIVPEHKLSRLLNLVRQAHPYEEVAYDIFPLNNKGKTYGIGLIGKPIKPLIINKKKIKNLAVACGSGGSLVAKAAEKGAEVFIVGEAGYHDQLLAQELGLELIIKGHYETENIIVPVLKKRLKKE
jgi:dinuclear metal center YbgI/SA1388 family protein